MQKTISKLKKELDTIFSLFIRLRGATEEGKKRGEYFIWVAKDQALREFIATLIHELVHVKQYEKKKWSGTGEAEANRLQYKLADRVWIDGVI